MKILHCLRNFFPHKVGGTEVYVRSLCKELQNLGFSVSVVKPSFGQAASNYTYEGVEVLEYLETSIPTPALQAGLMAPEGITNFRSLLERERPDAVHFHETAGSTGITIYHVEAAAEMGLAVFSTFHLPGNICMKSDFLYKGQSSCSGIINQHKCSTCLLHQKGFKYGSAEVMAVMSSLLQSKIVLSGPRKALNYPAYVNKHKQNLAVLDKACDGVFVLSRWYRDLLTANGFTKEKITVLPPTVPHQREANGLRGMHETVRFLFSGRISPIKGLHTALAAFSKLEQTNWSFDIYGYVDDENYYKHCLQLSEGNEKIRWMGMVTHAEMEERFTNYDALVFPSLAQETMGLTMLEAKAAKLPVIGSSIWTVEENIRDNRDGLIFKKGDSDDLRKALELVLKDTSLLSTMSRNAETPSSMNTSAGIIAQAYGAGVKRNKELASHTRVRSH